MKLNKNRPIITKLDHPDVIASALRESIPYYNSELPEQADAWIKTACDSYEAVEDDFWLADPALFAEVPEDKESPLYMTPDQLELALVVYGVRHAKDFVRATKVEALLLQLDTIRAEAVKG